MKGLRVAFDLDGVLANLEKPYRAAKQALFGADAPVTGRPQTRTRKTSQVRARPTALGGAA
jgi:phosphoglycolate phosphatase-like HAD superfamily hydrolase